MNLSDLAGYILACAVTATLAISAIIFAIFAIAMFVTFAIGYIKNERKNWRK